ncbi:hypothetical protein BJ508DRAFT_110855 [Ascobolus immersus RN42]|uniref:non-specific serine/threonine protein kinase n=1 Tax=Ascobolus immersus RN42 TaxID=1160509 RepID=A0A3N4HB44_ASCIM|nr:hypothetical protein BJ508DRAFT_110855 [Ascobolus immersus RN42]
MANNQMDQKKRTQEAIKREIAEATAGANGQPMKYKLLDMVGKGSFGAVFKGIDTQTKQIVAIKVLNLDQPGTSDLEDAQKEIAMLTNLKQSECVNVTAYYGCFLMGPKLWVIMEFCGGGSVRTLAKPGKIGEKYIVVILREVLVALQYIHRLGIIHRDLKAANILINNDGRVQICDFGVSAQLSNVGGKRKTLVGTPWWMAPELIKGTDYDYKVDMWSLGITLLEMANGRPPHSHEDAGRALMLIPTQPPPRLEGGEWSQGLRDVVALCLNEFPKDRPTAEELSKHRYIKACRTPTTVLRDLIARFEAWYKTSGVRQSFFFGQGPNTDTAEDEWDDDWDFDDYKKRMSLMPSWDEDNAGGGDKDGTVKPARPELGRFKTAPVGMGGGIHPLQRIFQPEGAAEGGIYLPDLNEEPVQKPQQQQQQTQQKMERPPVQQQHQQQQQQGQPRKGGFPVNAAFQGQFGQGANQSRQVTPVNTRPVTPQDRGNAVGGGGFGGGGGGFGGNAGGINMIDIPEFGDTLVMRSPPAPVRSNTQIRIPSYHEDVESEQEAITPNAAAPPSQPSVFNWGQPGQNPMKVAKRPKRSDSLGASPFGKLREPAPPLPQTDIGKIVDSLGDQDSSKGGLASPRRMPTSAPSSPPRQPALRRPQMPDHSKSAMHLGINAMHKKPTHVSSRSTPSMADMTATTPTQPMPSIPDGILGSFMPRHPSNKGMPPGPPGAPPPSGPLPQLPLGRKLNKRPSELALQAAAGRDIAPPPLTPGRKPPTPSAQMTRFNLTNAGTLGLSPSPYLPPATPKFPTMQRVQPFNVPSGPGHSTQSSRSDAPGPGHSAQSSRSGHMPYHSAQSSAASSSASLNQPRPQHPQQHSQHPPHLRPPHQRPAQPRPQHHQTRTPVPNTTTTSSSSSRPIPAPASTDPTLATADAATSDREAAHLALLRQHNLRPMPTHPVNPAIFDPFPPPSLLKSETESMLNLMIESLEVLGEAVERVHEYAKSRPEELSEEVRDAFVSDEPAMEPEFLQRWGGKGITTCSDQEWADLVDGLKTFLESDVSKQKERMERKKEGENEGWDTGEESGRESADPFALERFDESEEETPVARSGPGGPGGGGWDFGEVSGEGGRSGPPGGGGGGEELRGVELDRYLEELVEGVEKEGGR